MRHYEVVLLVRTDRSDQLQAMLKRYQDLVEKNNGNVHRLEDIGRLQLAYNIQDMHKAHYVLINIECDDQTLSEIESSFKFNDSIIRHLIVRMNKAETGPSILFSENNKEEKRKKDKDNKIIERKNESQLIEKVAEAKKDQVMESKSESDLAETEREGSEEQNEDVIDEKE
jgi:small subunit ribosomal protein S6